jgi:hypothetical protein
MEKIFAVFCVPSNPFFLDLKKSICSVQYFFELYIYVGTVRLVGCPLALKGHPFKTQREQQISLPKGANRFYVLQVGTQKQEICDHCRRLHPLGVLFRGVFP